MGRGSGFWEHLAENTELTEAPFPGQPIVEILGDCRVLIENHLGVKAYSREKILVNTKTGTVCVCGGGLEMLRKTRFQLVIRGKIDGVNILRRG